MNPECVCGYTLTYTMHMLSSFRYEQKDNVQVKLFLSNLNIYLLQQQSAKTGIFTYFSYLLLLFTCSKNSRKQRRKTMSSEPCILASDTSVLCTLFKLVQLVICREEHPMDVFLNIQKKMKRTKDMLNIRINIYHRPRLTRNNILSVYTCFKV